MTKAQLLMIMNSDRVVCRSPTSYYLSKFLKLSFLSFYLAVIRSVISCFHFGFHVGYPYFVTETIRGPFAYIKLLSLTSVASFTCDSDNDICELE